MTSGYTLVVFHIFVGTADIKVTPLRGSIHLNRDHCFYQFLRFRFIISDFNRIADFLQCFADFFHIISINGTYNITFADVFACLSMQIKPRRKVDLIIFRFTACTRGAATQGRSSSCPSLPYTRRTMLSDLPISPPKEAAPPDPP